MHRLLIAVASAALLGLAGAPAADGGSQGAQGDGADTVVFKDILRPDGAPRDEAQKLADGRACGASADNTYTDAAAFETCMRTCGWAPDHVVKPAKPTWIDPDTGLECHRAGIADICEPPRGTVTYTNKHGYPCRRTGLVAVCTNLPMRSP